MLGEGTQFATLINHTIDFKLSSRSSYQPSAPGIRLVAVLGVALIALTQSAVTTRMTETAFRLVQAAVSRAVVDPLLERLDELPSAPHPETNRGDRHG